MFPVRDILSAVRLGAWWLLVVSVFLGPAGLSGSVALTSASAATSCGAFCPCDEGVDDHESSDDAGETEHADNGPCRDGCPDGCPNCDCCRGAAMAIFPVALASSAASWVSERRFSPPSVTANGSGIGVFRPPRVSS